jgi:hypothetical protein
MPKASPQYPIPKPRNWYQSSAVNLGRCSPEPTADGAFTAWASDS